MNEPTFGAVIRDRDPRDYSLKEVGTFTPLPKVYTPDYSHLPVYFQGTQPSCGAHAGTALKLIQDKDTNPDYSPRFLWEGIKEIDSYPVEIGTDIYSIFKSLKDRGVCKFNLMGNDVHVSLQDYAHIKPSMEALEDAKSQEIESYATQYNPSFDDIKRAIYLNGAVIILFRCGQNMYKNKNGQVSWGTDILPLSPSNYPMDSGHFVTGIGFTENSIMFRNSWGESWGVKGDGFFNQDYIPYVVAIGTAIDKAQVTPQVLPKYLFSHNLTVGATGADVVALQKRLEAEGCLIMPKGVAYGYFGVLTLGAVKKYQREKGITPVSGYVGSITRSILNK